MIKLSFGMGNAKLGKETAIFSLPAGHACPAALLCQSRADKVTGKIKDGLRTVFRCYAASAENLFSNVRKSRWNNFEALQGKSVDEMASLLNASLPKRNTKLCRIHSSGDFFSQAYFDAWVKVARLNPEIIFYGYTKMVPFLVKRKFELPSNFRFVASYGGKFDSLIATHSLRSAKVINDESLAGGLPIDDDDSHVWNYDGDFALVIHGQQPKGSQLAKVVRARKMAGNGGYKSDYFHHYKKDLTKP
jgi:hypothetical protein